MTVKRAVLVPVRDTCGDIPTTFKVALVVLPDGDGEEVWLHQITGSYETVECFDREWDRRKSEEEKSKEKKRCLGFTSLSVEDAERLGEALVTLRCSRGFTGGAQMLRDWEDEIEQRQDQKQDQNQDQKGGRSSI